MSNESFEAVRAAAKRFVNEHIGLDELEDAIRAHREDTEPVPDDEPAPAPAAEDPAPAEDAPAEDAPAELAPAQAAPAEQSA